MKNIIKIIITAIIILFAYRIWIFLINANNNSTIVSTSNEKSFKNISSSDISKSWVAITTNLGIKYSEKKYIPSNSNIELLSIDEIKKYKKNVEDAIIWKNMVEIKEYLWIMKTDFKSLIMSSNDRKRTLEWVYNQLSLRYNKGIENIKILEKQKEVFTNEFQNLEKQIEQIKQTLQKDYKNVDTNWVNENIENLIKLRQEQIYLRTYIIFINNFLNSYYKLNEHNLNFINAITINKEAIEKWAYVVLPNTWNEILKDYGLLYTEEEYKEMKKKEETKE